MRPPPPGPSYEQPVSHNPVYYDQTALDDAPWFHRNIDRREAEHTSGRNMAPPDHRGC